MSPGNSWDELQRRKQIKDKKRRIRANTKITNTSRFDDLTYQIAIPRYLLVIIAFNLPALFFLIAPVFAPDLPVGAFLPLILLGILSVPLWLFLLLLYWRFFWWVNAVVLTLVTIVLTIRLALLLYSGGNIDLLFNEIPIG